MKTKNKITLGSLLLASSLYAQNTATVIMPYFATINYDSSLATTKESGSAGGIYFSTGNLNHLFELDYSGTNIKYKDTALLDLEQHDTTIAYSKYYTNFMAKIGIHHVRTTDTDLGDGYVAIGKIGGYSWDNYDKFSYGLEGYYSYYKEGKDDNDIAKKIDIIQFTPYYEYSKAISLNTRNTLGLKVNYILTDDYITKDYVSYELENTFYYKKFFTTLKAYTGEMKSGVKDGGFTVYNTKDIIQDGYSVKLGYNPIEHFSLSISYANNNFIEHGQTEETSNDVLVFSWNMNF